MYRPERAERCWLARGTEEYWFSSSSHERTTSIQYYEKFFSAYRGRFATVYVGAVWETTSRMRYLAANSEDAEFINRNISVLH